MKARVLKLHGSINWTEFQNDSLPRRLPKNADISTEYEFNRRIVIWPASTKYRETQLNPYAQLANKARELLRPPHNSQRVLAICGYSFGDSHINIELDRALRESARNLSMIVFSADDRPIGILEKWRNDDSINNQIMIYCKGGFWHGSTASLSEKNLPWWKFENITRLLRGER